MISRESRVVAPLAKNHDAEAADEIDAAEGNADSGH